MDEADACVCDRGGFGHQFCEPYPKRPTGIDIWRAGCSLLPNGRPHFEYREEEPGLWSFSRTSLPLLHEGGIRPTIRQGGEARVGLLDALKASNGHRRPRRRTLTS